MGFLFILLLVTLICLTVMVFGFVVDAVEIASLGLLGVVLVVVFGWFIGGALVYSSSEGTREATAQVFQTDVSTIFIVGGMPVLTHTDVVTFRAFKDRTNATLIQGYRVNLYNDTNYYGSYKIKD